MILKNGKRVDGIADALPIGSVIEYNGTDIPDGWEVLPEEPNIDNSKYETQEHRIGTWIDGKPLYRKTISFTTSWNTSYEFAHGIKDYDKLWIDTSSSYFFANENKVSIPLIANSYYGDISQWTDAMIYGDKVILYSSGGWGNGWEKVITINYTKTTD